MKNIIKIKNSISLWMDDIDKYIVYLCSIRLYKTKKIILDFEEYRYKVVKDLYAYEYSYGYTTYFFTTQTISIKKYIVFGPLREKIILLDAFDVGMNIENTGYSKSLVASEVNSSLRMYKDKLARQAEIDKGEII